MAVPLKNNWYHIHVPKNAGYSIAAAFGMDHVSHDLAMQMKDRYPNCFLAATVRNSFDRIFSCYKYDAGCKQSGISFEKFVFEKAVPGNLTWFGSGGVFKYVLDIGENNLINYYLNFSELQKNFDNLCDHIGVEKRILPVKNETYYKDYRTVYSPKMVDHISDYAKAEIAFFNWDFENPQQCADYFHQYIDLEKNNFSKKEMVEKNNINKLK